MPPGRRALLPALVMALWTATACASSPYTAQLSDWDLREKYCFTPEGDRDLDPGNSDSIFVVLAFSGGGTRAAALSLGGSFTSAYYALRGRDIFNRNSRFQKDFLYHPVQRDLLAQTAFRPTNWRRIKSRIEVAASYYESHVFGDATYEALVDKSRPFIIVNSTDVSKGSRFEFTQDQFDLICADLSRFPIARAVAASSAFPGHGLPRSHVKKVRTVGEAHQTMQELVSARRGRRSGRLSILSRLLFG